MASKLNELYEQLQTYQKINDKLNEDLKAVRKQLDLERQSKAFVTEAEHQALMDILKKEVLDKKRFEDLYDRAKKQIEELKQKLSRPHLQCGKRLSISDDEVVTLRKGGKTVNEIAEKLNVSTATISRILRENNVKVIKVYKTDADTDQMSAADKEIVRLRKEGITVKAISEQLNISTATINRVLMENNLRVAKVYNNNDAK